MPNNEVSLGFIENVLFHTLSHITNHISSGILGFSNDSIQSKSNTINYIYNNISHLFDELIKCNIEDVICVCERIKEKIKEFKNCYTDISYEESDLNLFSNKDLEELNKALTIFENSSKKGYEYVVEEKFNIAKRTQKPKRLCFKLCSFNGIVQKPI